MSKYFDIQNLIRANVKAMTPYSTARDEFKGTADVLLDANENPYGSPGTPGFNRYPDPRQWKLKQKISTIKGVPAEHIFLGNGSDEIIDLLYRAFCEPGRDAVIIVPPTYGMYEVSANLNAVQIKKVSLTPDFQLDMEAMAAHIDDDTKLIFLCSPNNPTGNSLHREDVETLLAHFNGIVVVDEAYINYSRQKSFIQELTEYPNLVVMQTFSKAWGLAALRLGMAFTSRDILEVLNKIKPPYNINQSTQDLAYEALNHVQQVNEWIKETVEEREKLMQSLKTLPFVSFIYPSDANFILVKTDAAKEIYQFLVDNGIIVRDRSSITLCEGCLRITIGTPEENARLLAEITKFEQ